jgi:hypothetical protein
MRKRTDIGFFGFPLAEFRFGTLCSTNTGDGMLMILLPAIAGTRYVNRLPHD